MTTLVRIPSVSGTDSENEAQGHMAGLFGAPGSTSIIGTARTLALLALDIYGHD